MLLIADFNLGASAREEMSIPILVGKYRDFDTKWYYDIGAKISMAMVSNSIAPFAGKVFQPLIMASLRCVLDRDFKKHLRKRTNIEEEKIAAEKKKKEEERKRIKAGEKV